MEVSTKYEDDKNIEYILHKIVSNSCVTATGIRAIKSDFINLVLKTDITIPW